MAATTPSPVAAERLPATVGPSRGWRAHPVLLALALAAASTYAAFASGATHGSQQARLEVLLVLIALGAMVSWASGGGIRWQTGRAATAGLVLLVALAVWSALGLLWSITPDGTWLEANRAIAYALVVALALALGSSDPRAPERMIALLLASASLVALYALGTKVVPGWRIPGLFDLDDATAVSRLRAPLGYSNALALLCALALPVSVTAACDPSRRRRERAPALAAGLLLAVVVGLTYSRGGVVAVAVGLVVLLALSRRRARTVLVTAGIGLATAPVLAVAFTLDGTSENGVGLATRISDGRLLGLTFVASLVLLLVGVSVAGRLGRRVAWPPARSRLMARGAVVLAALGLLVAVTAVAVSDRGLPGTVSDRLEAFTEPPRGDALAPGRLLTTTSQNRWAWWQEAAGAWSDRPVAGWGAGSFRATHLRYRVDELTVTQAHSVPLQLLSETGVVGLLLFLGGVGALGAAAVIRLRATPEGRGRDARVAALAALAAWGVHGLYDSDWSIPGVTVPALLLLGVTAATPADARRGRPAGSPALATAGVALALSLVAASAILPAWADGKATDALLAARAGADEIALGEAAAQADLAARLDPLSVRPLLAAAAVARRRGRLLASRAFLLEAVERQPESAEAWRDLAGASFTLADRVGFERAARRALELDPRSPRARQLALRAVAYRTPPGASATAVGTPLTPAPVPSPLVDPLADPLADPPAELGATGPTGP